MYRHPLSPAAGAFIEPGPWHYGADYIAVYFKAEKNLLQRLLPEGLTAGDGTCVAYVCEIISVSEKNPGLLHEDPDRTIYGEAAFGIGCSYEGNAGVYFPVMWVNKDWSLVRGWLNGYPKRLAEKIAMTRVHAENPLVNSVSAGSTLSGYCIAGGKKVLSLKVRLERKGAKEDLMAFGATFGVRRFPATDPSQNSISELVEVLKYNSRSSDVWVGQGEVTLDSADQVGRTQLLRGVSYKSGFSIRGANVLAKSGGSAE